MKRVLNYLGIALIIIACKPETNEAKKPLVQDKNTVLWKPLDSDVPYHPYNDKGEVLKGGFRYYKMDSP